MKRIMMISPRFFDYPCILKQGFEKEGYECDWYDDRPSDSFISKAMLRVSRKLSKLSIDKHNKKLVVNFEKGNYDYVIVIIGETVLKSTIEAMKTLYKCKTIYYMWDAISNFPFALELSKSFDKCYTFDKKDVNNYPWFKFLPLFYYSDNKSSKTLEMLDFSFIGTIKKGKYSMLSPLISQLKGIYDNYFIHMYLQSKLVYFYYKIFNRKEFKKAGISEFNYSMVTREKTSLVTEASKIVLDCQMTGQNGLTMRTFESLNMEKKLITTNKEIINYDFYSEENIYIYNGVIDFNNIFFKTNFNKIDEKIWQNYSVKSWVSQIMEE